MNDEACPWLLPDHGACVLHGVHTRHMSDDLSRWETPVMNAPYLLSAEGNTLPWASVLRQCDEVVEPNVSGYWGRCDLAAGHEQVGEVDHAINGGVHVLRWSSVYE